MTSDFIEDQWIVIQHKTFVNWANEQLIRGNRSVENLTSDFCDGVKLVALVEALQLKKIGKVYSKPANRIQRLHNVSLALQAIREDNVKLVNIGTDDIVGGNLKLILALLWHLIIRYQISSSKTKASHRKLMLEWFQQVLPELNISNFSSDWNNGLALHALLEFFKPGLSPNWRKLSPRDGVKNCRLAMQLAKEHLSIPAVISPEDFSSSSLDEQSAMTYLSYFIRKDSPGYIETLNWACKQLKSTNISNLTTAWNDGYYLCALVHSLGGEVKGWPNIDRKNRVAVCQLGLESAKSLGIQPMFTASEMADPNLDHLSLMAYLSKFRKTSPKKRQPNSLSVDCFLLGIKTGKETRFRIISAVKDCQHEQVRTWVTGPSSEVICDIKWEKNVAFCSFTPKEAGVNQLHVTYEGVDIKDCPISFEVQEDVSKVKVTCNTLSCQVGHLCQVFIHGSLDQTASVEVRLTNPLGETTLLRTVKTSNGLEATFQPSCAGTWKHQTFVARQEVSVSEVLVSDPAKAVLTVPEHGVIGEEVACLVDLTESGSYDLNVAVTSSDDSRLEDLRITNYGDVRHITFIPQAAGPHRVTALVEDVPINGSPSFLEVVDPAHIVASGEGLFRGSKGMEAHFSVDTGGLDGDVTVDVEESGERVTCVQETRSPSVFEFYYLPARAGVYIIRIYWRRKLVAGSPYTVCVTDKSNVILLDKLQELQDDRERLALEYGRATELHFDISQAGPGTLKGEVLSPSGKLPVEVVIDQNRAMISFVAWQEGEHYIHLYWSTARLEYSPILAYCPGPSLPVDESKVIVQGKGLESARATVPAEFLIDGSRAGPGIPKVRLQGIHSDLPVEIKSLKYDRYLCSYVSNIPGSFLLYVYWSGHLLAACPYKVAVSSKGDVRKVKVLGDGLKGGVANKELTIFVDAQESGPGEVTAECHSHRQSARCDIKETGPGLYTLRIFPTEPDKHILQIRYDGQHVTGSPFNIRISEPPDPTKVKVFGPGIADGLIDDFESRFVVDTQGAGAGQLSVKIRGPQGGFKVDMSRESKAERRIVCRYDPREAGQYVINIKWSGTDIPGSPYVVNVVETTEELGRLRSGSDIRGWRTDI